MALEYIKPTIEIVVMLTEESLANTYWEGSWHNEGYWGSPNCDQNV